MNELSIAKRICIAFVFCAATAIATPAQTFTTLHSFDRTDGSSPKAVLIQASDGNLYGTTAYGGSNSCSYGCGTVFKIMPDGPLTVLHSFDGTDGYAPYGGLLQGTNGNLYGTTADGGTSAACTFGCGTVFTITPDGTLTVLHSFDGSDGADPSAPLVQATDGNFYGTTTNGGTSSACGQYGCGTVFKITPNGTLTSLHSFGDGTDGIFPEGPLLQASSGNFYGTTAEGGFGHDGTVFKITPSGALTILYSFCAKVRCSDGEFPIAGLVKGADGSFFGTTQSGGTGGCYKGCGTVFKITSSGVLIPLHSFDGAEGEGDYPTAGLVQATDGNLYGTTFKGGANYRGTVFRITAGGQLTTLHSFDTTDGEEPYGGLVQDTNGTLYGTTSGVGPGNNGTVFSLSVGLGPFVEANPAAAKVGAAVTILGTNLTGATSVTINGVAATFTVKSKSEITTTVPAGATTGTVQVVTPGGTLSSNVPFRVLP